MFLRPVNLYLERVGSSAEARLANLLGAAAAGLTDAIGDAAAADPRLDTRAATALVALLDFAPSGPVRMLSQVVGLTHSGAVRLVNRLAAAGYVQRGPGTDSRSVTVALTAQGRSAAQRIREHRERVITGALAGLTGTQRGQLTAACEMIIANLTDQRLARRAAGAPPAAGALCRMCDFTACGRPGGRCPAAATARGRSR
jgi:DNA-binding MarR family transcriptional regulator